MCMMKETEVTLMRSLADEPEVDVVHTLRVNGYHMISAIMLRDISFVWRKMDETGEAFHHRVMEAIRSKK